MRKLPLQAALSLLLSVLIQFLSPPSAHAAPGDFLFKWGAQQQFSDPSGVAVDGSGNVYVTDTDGVQVFDSSGKRVGNWGSYGSGDGKLVYPKGVAVGRNGRVYVVDSGNNRIQVFDSKGHFLGKWGGGWYNGTVNGIAIDASGNVYVADPGYYDPVSRDYSGDSVRVFDSEGNFLRYLGSHGTGDGQFSGPSSVAVDQNGNLYLADQTARVQVFSPTGEFIKTAFTELAFGLAIAIGGSGDLYVVGYDNSQAPGLVKVYDPAGRLLRELQFSDDYYSEHYWLPIAIAADRQGNAYLLDSMNAGLRVFDASGNLLGQWGSYGTADAQLAYPVGIATDSNGNVYETNGYPNEGAVSNRKIRVFDSQGNFLRRWTTDTDETIGIAVDRGDKVYLVANPIQIFDGSGNLLGKIGDVGSEEGEFVNPFGVAVDKNGNIFVTDTYNSKVEIFSNDGKFLGELGSYGSGNGEFNYPQGIAVDESNNVYVVDSGNARIQVFDSARNFLRKWGGPGFSNGLFSNPTGVAVDPGGKVYVADTGNNRIQLFDSTGTFLLKWGREGHENGEFRGAQGVAVNRSGSRVYVADTGNSRIQAFEGDSVVSYSMSGTVHEGSGTGPLLAGAKLTIAGKSAITGSDGSFSITGIPAGSYTLTISKPGYTTKSFTGYLVNRNRVGSWFYLFPAPRYSLSGTVREGSATGPLLPGATVKIAGKSATTSSSGSFNITGIPAGSYTLTISKQGYLTKSFTGYLINKNRSGAWFYLAPMTKSSMSGKEHNGGATAR